jgi:SAM-dependent methyltransferase
MKLNLGAGDTKIDGFINCDYDPAANPDYCFNLEKDPFPFPDNSVDTVVAHHVLEHMGEGYFHCLQEIYRVCQPGAIIHIRVPHHRHDHFLDDATHRRPITVQGIRLFSQKYNKLCRAQKVAASRLGEYFKVDFEILDFQYTPSDNYREVFEGKPKDEVERYISEHNNVVQEVYIKLVVVKDDN